MKDRKLCEAHRDIALACEAGNVFHCILPTHLVPEYCSLNRGCDFGNVADRPSCRSARGWTGAVVYFDAVTACASMLTALVCHQSSRDHPTTEALMATGFSADVAAMSHEAMQAPASETVAITTPSSASVRCSVQYVGSHARGAGGGSYATRIQGWRTLGGSCIWYAHAEHLAACR